MMRSGFFAVVLLLLSVGAGPLVPAVASEGVGAPVVTVSPDAVWVDTSWVFVEWDLDYEDEVLGYALLVDGQETTDPGTVVNEPGPSTWLELEDGEQWLHIRAVLPGDVGGPVAHVRVGVDTVPPEIAELRSLTHPVEVVSTDPDVTVEWDEPVDLSGVVGYEAWLSPEEFFDPYAAEDVPESMSLPSVEFTVPEDGTWYVHVRAQDAAGLWGPHVSYALAVDTAPPGAPAVVGSHVDAVATSQRSVVMNFVEAEGDNVDRWAALVDDEPTTVPGISLARSEARIAATVEPGDSWLHVRGRDSLGRWGPTTHTKLVVTDDPVVVEVASGQPFWSAQDVDLVCPAAADLTLVTVASDSSIAVVGALDDVSTGRCVVEWDVTETDDDERVWPDGEYELVVVDDTDSEVSERVAVSVQVDLTVSGRLLANYAAGRVESEDLAHMLLQTISDPLAVPERYRADSELDVPSSVDLVQALMAEGGLSETMAERLTPVDDTPQKRGSQTEPVSSCDNEVSLDDVIFDCRVHSENFIVHFDSAHVGTMVGNDSEFVTMIVDSLERAREVYQEDGFRIPGGLSVFLSHKMPSNSGIALPSMPILFGLGGSTPPVIIMSSDHTQVQEYLPHHELFHQVQYQYISAERVALPINNPYWWMEATAEWAAHRVQEMRDDFDHTDEYAGQLRAFLDGPHLPYSRGAIWPEGGPEYGAFVLTKFLDENYGGAEPVEFSWRQVVKWPFGMSPAGAVHSTMRHYGDHYSDAIHRFREWTYVLGRAQGKSTGFGHPDAQPTEFWRLRVGPDYRPPHQSITLSSTTRTATGVTELHPGGAKYIEITGPADLTGEVIVEVTRPPLESRVSVIQGIEEFPHQCPDQPVLYRGSAHAAALNESPSALTVPIGGWCGKAVLVITNTNPMPNPAPNLLLKPVLGPSWDPFPKAEFEWSLTYRPHGAVVESAPLSVGIHSHGGLGYKGDGIHHANIAPQPYLYDGWGVSDGDEHGGVFGALHTTNQTGQLEPVEITFSENEAEVVTATGDLLVTHQVRPSGQDDLYAIDVTVERTGPPSANPVTYRRTMDWSFGVMTYLTWELVSGGDDSRVALLTDRPSAGDPWYPAATHQWPGYVDRVGPWVLGATIDLDLGVVAPSTPVEFTLFYGISADTDDARAALDGVGADVFSLQESSALSDETVGVFAYRADPAQAP